MGACGFVCPTRARKTQNGKATVGRCRFQESMSRPWPVSWSNSDRRLQGQRLPPHFRLYRVRRFASVESALMIVGHRFERTITVSRFGQTSGVQQQALDYVDKFVEV